MIEINVPMSFGVCRWCGAPYGVPTAVWENPAITKRCPRGHRHSDGRTPELEISDLIEHVTQANSSRTTLMRANASLRGRVTKLTAALREAKR